MSETEARPTGCCGKCPPLARGGYDCTCRGNPRCHETKRVCYLGPQQMRGLDLACIPLRRAYGIPYLVGSVNTRRDFRDVDLRLILPDGHRLFRKENRHMALNFMISEYLRAATDLPVDFQFQPQTEANEYRANFRNPMGLRWDVP